MLKIGDFSKICQTSVRALRHWESQGLLKPALSDPRTGYRYYTIDQIEQVNRILALRTMGLSLAQIASLMAENVTITDIRAMLRLKQAELQQQIAQAAEMLTVVESRLSEIDSDGTLPGYEVALKSVEAQPVLAVRQTLPDMQALVDLLYETHGYAREKASTNLLAVFYDDGYQDETLDVEVGFPVETGSRHPIPLKHGREMSLRVLPGVEQLACTIHRGEWLKLSHGYISLGRWIVNNGYQIAGAGREIFHAIDWDNQQNATVTELQFPVVKRPA
jgi:DNA-binding transcriptional MerR regulator